MADTARGTVGDKTDGVKDGAVRPVGRAEDGTEGTGWRGRESGDGTEEAVRDGRDGDGRRRHHILMNRLRV